jgi:hypothetical protein
VNLWKGPITLFRTEMYSSSPYIFIRSLICRIPSAFETPEPEIQCILFKRVILYLYIIYVFDPIYSAPVGFRLNDRYYGKGMMMTIDIGYKTSELTRISCSRGACPLACMYGACLPICKEQTARHLASGMAVHTKIS